MAWHENTVKHQHQKKAKMKITKKQYRHGVRKHQQSVSSGIKAWRKRRNNQRNREAKHRRSGISAKSEEISITAS